ncbi:PilW family protein [Pseudomonas matsuisoli]|uniref:Type 4 fimbrial biogenesis protein PilW n=1 Tax=Pseudomonas matsuisoli TaxID=1515666 RepID=A0A917PZX0_9PSED|nr:prepilin-type N-terminal cleavage/methylation domain-containing protein [Pseudomonas matsuisoli]GGK01730.1 type 4 fimbrial biogenesis protein PilW [Pseudomonas matsuisoli]
MNNVHQRGLSLVELLVALAISSFLILGVTQLYIDNKRSYVFQQSQSQNSETARYALLILQQELAKTGYRRRPDEAFEGAFPASNVGECDFAPGTTLITAKDYSATNSNKQNAEAGICLRYQPRSEHDLDCLGNAVTNTTGIDKPYTSTSEIVVQRFYVAGDTFRCESRRTDKDGTAKGNTSSAELTSGLTALKYEFGVGTAADNRAITNYTGDPTDKPILAVRYTVLLESGANLRESVGADDALAEWQTLTNADAAEMASLKTADERQLYQVFQNMIALRNLLP